MAHWLLVKLMDHGYCMLYFCGELRGSFVALGRSSGWDFYRKTVLFCSRVLRVKTSWLGGVA